MAEESKTSTNTKLFVTLKNWLLLQNPPFIPRPPVMMLPLRLPAEQFKTYFLALLADKGFSRVIETVSKVDKSFRRSMPYRTQPRRGRFPYQQSNFQAYQRPPPRVIRYRCGEPGHKSPQCWKRAPSRQPSSSVPAQPRPGGPLT